MNGKEQRAHTTRVEQLARAIDAAEFLIGEIDQRVASLGNDTLETFKTEIIDRQVAVEAAKLEARKMMQAESAERLAQLALQSGRLQRLERLADAGFLSRLRWLLSGRLPEPSAAPEDAQCRAERG